jgi:hypothetical protein
MPGCCRGGDICPFLILVFVLILIRQYGQCTRVPLFLVHTCVCDNRRDFALGFPMFVVVFICIVGRHIISIYLFFFLFVFVFVLFLFLFLFFLLGIVIIIIVVVVVIIISGGSSGGCQS